MLVVHDVNKLQRYEMMYKLAKKLTEENTVLTVVDYLRPLEYARSSRPIARVWYIMI